MDIKVKSLYVKSSPRKIRPTLMNLRGQNAVTAMTSLKFTNRKGARLMADLIKSGVAVAKENDLDIEKLYIKSVYCNEGPRLKRRQIGSRGRSDAILKRMSHLNLTLSDIIEVKESKEELKKEETTKKPSKSNDSNSKENIKETK